MVLLPSKQLILADLKLKKAKCFIGYGSSKF